MSRSRRSKRKGVVKHYPIFWQACRRIAKAEERPFSRYVGKQVMPKTSEYRSEGTIRFFTLTLLKGEPYEAIRNYDRNQS